MKKVFDIRGNQIKKGDLIAFAKRMPTTAELFIARVESIKKGKSRSKLYGFGKPCLMLELEVINGSGKSRVFKTSLETPLRRVLKL